MFCDRCGTRLDPSQSFCPSCGKPTGVAALPAPYPKGRVANHVRVLGVLWLASSALHLIPGLFLVAFFRHAAPDVPFFVIEIVRTVGFLMICVAVLGLMAGWGLLERQPWARMLTIILGVLNLINPPFGTALGIYTLWVLLPSSSETEYEQLAGMA